MAKKKKGGKRGNSRKGSKKNKGRKSKRGFPAWAKLAIVIAAGSALGTVAENAGLLGKGTVSGPAVGIAVAGGISTGFRRLPSAPILAAIAGAQGFRTVSRTETYAKIERGAEEVAAKFLGASKSTSVANLTKDTPSSSGPSYAETADDLATTLAALHGK
jgi:hypothetical protein